MFYQVVDTKENKFNFSSFTFMDFSMISHKRNSFGIDKMPTLPKTSQRSKDMYVPSMSIFPLKK